MNNQQYDIDNDEGLFAFDSYDVGRIRGSTLPSRQYGGGNRQDLTDPRPSHDPALTSGEVEGRESSTPGLEKGKQVSIPVPIRSTSIIYDVFDVSPSTDRDMGPAPSSFVAPSDFSSFSPSSFLLSSPSSSSSSSYQPAFDSLSQAASAVSSPGTTSPASGGVSCKGKSREMPPSLPPLTFSPTELGDGATTWLSFQEATLSSSFSSPNRYSDGSSPGSPETSQSPSNAGASGSSSDKRTTSPLSYHPSRCKSLSNISVDPEATMQTEKAKPMPIRAQSYLTRKLAAVSKRGTPTHSRPTSPTLVETQESFQTGTFQYDANSTMSMGRRAWYVAPQMSDSTSRTIVSRLPPPTPSLTLEGVFDNRTPPRELLKHKGRSQSEPIPFSVLDLVPVYSTDIFEPLPLFIKNYFVDNIPREIHLHILRSFVQMYVDDHRRAVDSGRWSINRASASRNQWVGKERGIRELLKLSRVSRSWRSMVFDGQLWIDLDLHGFPKLPYHVLLQITQAAGAFIKGLNLAGQGHLNPEGLMAMASNLCLVAPEESLSHTQLTTVNLQGCGSITTRSLHHLLIRSRSLRKLTLKGLGAVTNTTCEILAAYCPNLVSLNLNRCSNMDAGGIQFMAKSTTSRGEHLQLKELRLCGLKYMSDSAMQALGLACPYLEVLDLSYVRQLHNSALESFVACNDREISDEELGVETVVVTGRDLGRDTNDSGRYRRRVTRLRHLNMSFCVLLTDTACANMAHSLPRLEYLEMAGIGTDLKDAGLIRLLERTPLIKRVDLEDATELTDALLATITPKPHKQTNGPQTREPEAQPGDQLQSLVLSYAYNLTDPAILALVRNCPKLVHLEVDNTRIGSAVVREFVRLSQQRKHKDARLVAVDCRGVGEHVVKDLSGSTRPRLGWRAYASRKLSFLDGRDGNEEDLRVGQDECDPSRVVLKTFYSWQTVDAVKASREKRRRGNHRRGASASGLGDDEEVSPGRTTRWWSPGGRRSGRNSPPTVMDIPNSEGCRAM